MGHPHRVGIVGLGVISRAYLETLTGVQSLSITAVADLDRSRANALAEHLPDATAMSVEDLLRSPDVDTVLNLTIPAAHAEIALAAIANRKHVYGEKPLATTLADGQAIMDAAAAAGVRVGSAPDTVLGTGTQTARAAIDAGRIGRATAASATMVTPGHERWHPNPDFYYQEGGGPLLDMGPYYIAALIQLLGPIRAVTGATSRLRNSRTISSGARSGERVPVEVDTHVTGVLEHANGVLSTITTSFDGTASMAPPIEVHGEAGSLLVPDPNQFDGEVREMRLGDADWRTLDPSAGYAGGGRGVGLLDFVSADDDREARAGGQLALHSLEIMLGLLESAREGRRLELETTVERPLPVPLTGEATWKA